jgi:hypothetical protein
MNGMNLSCFVEYVPDFFWLIKIRLISCHHVKRRPERDFGEWRLRIVSPF